MVPHRSSPDRLKTFHVIRRESAATQWLGYRLDHSQRSIVEPEHIALNDDDVLNQRGVGMTRALAGYLTGANGRDMVFGLSLNNVAAPDVLSDSLTIIADHGAIVEEIHART